MSTQTFSELCLSSSANWVIRLPVGSPRFLSDQTSLVGAVGAVENVGVVGRRFPSVVGRRGFIAAFHNTSASIARF